MKSAVVYALIATLAAPSVSFAARTSDVRTWKPGAEVTLRTPRSGPSRRYFISADDDAITLLNVSNPGVPSDVAKLLRRAIAKHPEYFPIPNGRTIALDTRASIDASGVSVTGQKIAGYDQVFERILRADVASGAVSLEVDTGWSRSKSTAAYLGALFGGLTLWVIISCANAPRGC